jgi:hypothetical protein
MNLLISLPKNDLSLAQAALEGGADGVKVHLNAYHRASGNQFGSFTEELPFLKELSKLSGSKFVMVGQDALPTEEEMNQLEELGFEGFNLYLSHAKPHLLRSSMRPILALQKGYNHEEIEKIKRVPGSWIEASIIDFADYSKELTTQDLIAYKDIVDTFDRPVILPSQKKLVPGDVSKLKECGIAALLLGIIVTGDTPESIRTAARAFRERLSS